MPLTHLLEGIFMITFKICVYFKLVDGIIWRLSIRNIGELDSVLQWMVESYPDWGE
jgi:hypothetical protein